MTELRIGTSGWSYPHGPGTWNRVFYPVPPARRRSSRFDELAYYAEHFDTVEVNSTFYRMPSPGTTLSWIRRTPAGFEFSVKLFQKFTHPGMFEAATGEPDVITREDVEQFKAAVDPIASHGKLGAILAQFPPSFHNRPESREHLQRLLRAFGEYTLAVELRHRSWSDDATRTTALLDECDAIWTGIDEPTFQSSVRRPDRLDTGRVVYWRFHGRNREKWWRHQHADERYDYLYSDGELRPFAASARERLAKKQYLYFNNHFAAKAVANAVALRHHLGLPAPGTYPAEFVRRYPEVSHIVSITAKSPLLDTSS